MELQKKDTRISLAPGDDDFDDGFDHLKTGQSFGKTLTISSNPHLTKSSVIDDEVREAWIHRGWTLRSSIMRHADGDLSGLAAGNAGGDTDRSHEELVFQKQKRLDELTEVNQFLHSTLCSKTIRIEELRVKVDALVAGLVAARSVEDGARTTSLAALEEQILSEEKQKQDMQLNLSQEIRECEDKLASIAASNDALAEVNAKNKKSLKEQQTEIHQRQKAIKHLERQIHVQESAQRNIANQSGTAIPEDGLAETSNNFESHSVLNPKADSKSLLRGDQARAQLQEQMRRLQEQKMTKTMDMTKESATTMSDLKSLPGLNLTDLLGEDASLSSPLSVASPRGNSKIGRKAASGISD